MVSRHVLHSHVRYGFHFSCEIWFPLASFLFSFIHHSITRSSHSTHCNAIFLSWHVTWNPFISHRKSSLPPPPPRVASAVHLRIPIVILAVLSLIKLLYVRKNRSSLKASINTQRWCIHYRQLANWVTFRAAVHCFIHEMFMNSRITSTPYSLSELIFIEPMCTTSRPTCRSTHLTLLQGSTQGACLSRLQQGHSESSGSTSNMQRTVPWTELHSTKKNYIGVVRMFVVYRGHWFYSYYMVFS